MGCGGGQKEVNQPIRVATVTGVLKVTITEGFLEHVTSSFFSMDPYAVVKLSNQKFTSKVVSKGGQQPKFNEAFTFYINSCYKNHGRNLQVSLWDKGRTGDSEIGFGIIDLDPIINFKVPRSAMRCFVNYDRKPAGYVSLTTQFRQEKSESLAIRFETAAIRRKTRSLGTMNCHVQVTIGQQVLKTSSSKDTEQMPPVWANDILIFNVPLCVSKAQVIVYDVDIVIGDLQLDLVQLLSTKNEQSFNQQFDFEDKVTAGSLKFQTLVGNSPNFSEIKAVHRKKKQVKEEKKEETKDDIKKQEIQKSDIKKEDNKKSDIKQDEKKQNKSEIQPVENIAN